MKMIRALLLSFTLVAFADKYAAFNNFNLFDLFFPYDFEHHARDNTGAVKVGLGKVKKSGVKNERTMVSTQVDFGLERYGMGQVEVFWGGKWNEISSVLNYDFRAHHVGVAYSDTLPGDSAWRLSGVFHMLDAKEPDLTNTGMDVSAGWSTYFGGLRFNIGGSFFTRIDEDILASLGDSTIRRLKVNTGLEFDITEESKLGVGVTGESGKLGSVNLRRIVPDISFRFDSFGVPITVKAEYYLTHTDDDVYGLYPILPILSQSSKSGRFFKTAVGAEVDLGFMFYVYPELSWFELGTGSWQASIELVIPFQ